MSPVNPLGLNIHPQILQSDLLIFPYRIISWENFPKIIWSILFIFLINFSFNYVLIYLWGENWCWHDRLVKFLAYHDQDAILAAHCPLTGRYFEPSVRHKFFNPLPTRAKYTQQLAAISQQPEFFYSRQHKWPGCW